MMDDNGSREHFGCQRCWPPSADAAWGVRSTLTPVVKLIDESHFHVQILACPDCTQRFLSVFTEMIDWEGGDDSQDWTLLPITGAEAADLVRQRDSLTEAKLDTLAPSRRCLRFDHPKATAPRIFWSTGISIGLHD